WGLRRICKRRSAWGPSLTGAILLLRRDSRAWFSIAVESGRRDGDHRRSPPCCLPAAPNVAKARKMTVAPAKSPGGADFYAPDGSYAVARLGLSLLIATLV